MGYSNQKLPYLLPHLLGGSWDLRVVSPVISPLIGVITKYEYSYQNYNPVLAKPHDP